MERGEREIAPNGREISRKVRYTEMATGLHYKNERGEWVESKEEIEIMAIAISFSFDPREWGRPGKRK